MSKQNELTTYYIRLKTYDSDGQVIPWEKIPATCVQCTSAQISTYATLRSQETGCEVRINRERSLQGHYYTGTLARDTTRLMSTIFGSTSKPTNDGD